MRAPNGLDAGFRQTKVQYLALLDQILDRASHILDGHVGVDPVLVEQIDSVSAQAPQHAVHHPPDVIWLAVETFESLARFLIYVPAELGGDHHLIANALQRLAEDIFRNERTICFRRVEEGDA